MYRIRPYFPDFPVKPKCILYHLSCYHGTSEALTNSLQSNSTLSPHFELTAKETVKEKPDHQILKLVDDEFVIRLLKLSSRLDNFINVFDNQVTKKLEKVEKTKKETTGRTQHDVGKLSTSKSPKEQRNDDLHSNSPDVVHAHIGPTSCAVFPIHDYGDDFRKKYFGEVLQCNLRSSDKIFFEILKRIGGKRRVSFDGSNVSSENGCVVIKLCLDSNGEKKISIRQKDQGKIEGDLSVWKFLGSLLGIYCPSDHAVSALTDHWLALISSSQIDELSRRISVHLGTHDFLSSQHAICLSDLVLRCCFVDTKTTELLKWTDIKASNNVQLWAKRVDDACANY